MKSDKKSKRELYYLHLKFVQINNFDLNVAFFVTTDIVHIVI